MTMQPLGADFQGHPVPTSAVAQATGFRLKGLRESPRLPVISRCCPPHPLSLQESSRDTPLPPTHTLFKLAMEKYSVSAKPEGPC